MAQAKKSRPQTTPSGGQRHTSPSGWVWLVLGVTIGLFIAFLTYLLMTKPSDNPPVHNTPTQTSEPKTTPAPKRETTSNAATEPRFSFYTELPKIKVEIPDAEFTPPASNTEKKSPSATPHPPNERLTPTASPPSQVATPRPAYVLQAGSFKKHREADQLKARLALIGIEANIQAVSVNKNDRWFRVRIGPYAKQEQAKAVKEKLRKNRIPAIVLKLGP